LRILFRPTTQSATPDQRRAQALAVAIPTAPRGAPRAGIALGLAAKEPGESGLSVDAAIAALGDGRLTGAAHGGPMAGCLGGIIASTTDAAAARCFTMGLGRRTGRSGRKDSLHGRHQRRPSLSARPRSAPPPHGRRQRPPGRAHRYRAARCRARSRSLEAGLIETRRRRAPRHE
jgi:hypothetical protein